MKRLLIGLVGGGLALSLAAAAAGIYLWTTPESNPESSRRPSPPPASSRLTPTPVPMVAHPRTSPSDFQSGLSLLIYSHEQEPTSAYGQLLDRLVADNVNSLSVTFPIYSDGLQSNSVHRGQYTPSDAYLTEVIRQARARGFSVLLRPLIDNANLQPHWRGEMQPASPTQWFASYGQLILSYAQLASQTGAQALDVGTELVSMETYVSSWQNLIAQARQVFSGQVTYSFNWGTSFATGFWPQLDFVSVDAYFPLDQTPAQATAADMAADWQRWIAVMKSADQPYGKPIVLTEVGVVPRTDAYRRPWDPGVSNTSDVEEQRTYYQGTCQAVKSAVAGLYWWETGPELPASLAPDDYNPITRPAEQEVTRCYSTP